MELEFHIGDKLVSIWEPNKIGTVVNIKKGFYDKPVYTVMYDDYNEYCNYAMAFKKAEVEE